MSTLPPFLKVVGKVAIIVIVVLIAVSFVGRFFFGTQSSLSSFSIAEPSMTKSTMMGYSDSGSAGNVESTRLGMMPSSYEAAPVANVSSRMVIESSYLSLLVSDVKKVKNDVIAYASTVGGYMVSADLNGDVESPTATITVRIPNDQLENALNHFRSQAIRVVSENLQGYDVTDQYVDIDTRLSLLEKTKSQFETILNKATEISDISNLTQQIINVQSQIDSLKGQQESLSKNAELSKVTVYLSTDEIALPYQPSDAFRPSVIYKQAVRSLVTTLRHVASLFIWIGVYAVIWIPVLVVIIFILHRKRNIKK